MDILGDILMILIPSAAIFFTAFYILKQFFENEQKKRTLELSKAGRSTLMPIRLQAYERMVLFLERIGPDNLVMRVYQKDMSAKELRDKLQQAIRTEFDHNLAQQIYVSKPGWELVKAAKEEMVKVINLSAGKVPENANGLDLSRVLLTTTASMDKLPSQVAIDYLKKEIAQYF